MSKSESVRRAAALRYEGDPAQDAPVIVAAGMGVAAQQILEIAREHQIPVYTDQSLATLLSQFECGSRIPPALYGVVSDMLQMFLELADMEKEARGNAD